MLKCVTFAFVRLWVCSVFTGKGCIPGTIDVGTTFYSIRFVSPWPSFTSPALDGLAIGLSVSFNYRPFPRHCRWDVSKFWCSASRWVINLTPLRIDGPHGSKRRQRARFWAETIERNYPEYLSLARPYHVGAGIWKPRRVQLTGECCVGPQIADRSSSDGQ